MKSGSAGMLSFRYARTVPAAPFRRSWWPNDIPPSSFVTERYAFFSCEAGRAFLAVYKGGGEAYYWRP